MAGDPFTLESLSCCSVAQDDSRRLMAAARRDGTVVVAAVDPHVITLCSNKMDCYINALAINAENK